jgi:hypothetical protein
MAGGVLVWWLGLCAAAVVNIAAWTAAAKALRNRRTEYPADVYAVRRAVLALSAVYVAGCAFRSFLPMIDVPRLCLHDTWISRIAVGRSVATVAELCFVAQWALLLREAGAVAQHRCTRVAAGILVPMIVAAELSSWYAVLTTDNLFHAVENSLWTAAALLAMLACAGLRTRVDETNRRLLGYAIGCGAAYVGFMVVVDVPMYLARWLADTTTGRDYLTISEGLAQVAQRCTVAVSWGAWREDVAWLSLYFTAAVWLSIALAHVPAFRASREPVQAAAGSSAAARPE